MSSLANTQQSGSFWDLSLYEAQRKPHEVVTDTSIVSVSPRALHSELMCPICLDLMKNAQTTKECLHRFCQECIITALRSGNKECPTCRKKLVSKRSLRSDPNFDALIAKIYPNRDELFQNQEKQRPTIQPSLHSLPSRKRRAATPQDAVSSEPHSPSPIEKAPKTELDEAERNDSCGSKEDEEEVRLEFQLRPHPSDKSVSTLDIRNLATSPDATVAHLVKFLSLVQEPKGDKSTTNNCTDTFTISTLFGADESSYVTLSGTTSLKQICDNYWTPGEKMMLYFSSGEPTAPAQ